VSFSIDATLNCVV